MTTLDLREGTVSVFFVELITESDSLRLNGGALGGTVVGACAGLLLVLVCVFLWYRKRRPIPIENPPVTVDQGAGPIIFHTPTLPADVEQYQPLSTSLSTNANLLQLPSTSTPSPPHSNSSASNSGSRSRLVLHNPNPSFSGIVGSAQESAPASENTRLYQTPVHVSGVAKPTYISFIPDPTFCLFYSQATRPLPQPEQSNSRLRPTALALPSLPGGDLRDVRMRVEGRSQDFGPITFEPDPEHDENLLPPDYYQATQPFPPQRR